MSKDADGPARCQCCGVKLLYSYGGLCRPCNRGGKDLRVLLAIAERDQEVAG